MIFSKSERGNNGIEFPSAVLIENNESEMGDNNFKMKALFTQQVAQGVWVEPGL